MHHNYVWHIKSIYPTKFQVNTVKNIEVILKNVFSHARVMIIGVSSDLEPWHNYAILSKYFYIARCTKCKGLI